MLISISAENSRPLLLGVIYHPLKLGYLALFQAEFKRLHPSYPMTVIVGDFNVDFNRTFHDSLIIDFCICNHLFIRTSLLRIFPYHSSQCIFSHLHKSLLSYHAFVKSFQGQQSFSSLTTLLRSPLISLFIAFLLVPSQFSLIYRLGCNRSATLDGKIEILNYYLLMTRDAPRQSFRARRPSAP